MSDPFHIQIYPKYNQIYRFSNHSSKYHDDNDNDNSILSSSLVLYFLIGCIGMLSCLRCIPACFHMCGSICKIEEEMRRPIENDISISEDTDEENYIPPEHLQSASSNNVHVDIISNTNNTNSKNENSEDENSEDLPTYGELFSDN